MMTLLELVMTLLELRSSKKWTVTRKTTEGWMSQYNRVSHAAMPGFLMQGDGKCVVKVRCKVCCEFREQSISSWNYRPKFIERTSNIRLLLARPCKVCHVLVSNWSLLHQAPCPPEYAPITRAFAHDMLDSALHFYCKRKAPVYKVFPLWKWKQGMAWKLEVAIKMLMPAPLFILLHLNNWKSWKTSLAKWISLDAITDTANKECELFMVQYLDSKVTDSKVHVQGTGFWLWDIWTVVEVRAFTNAMTKCFAMLACKI